MTVRAKVAVECHPERAQRVEGPMCLLTVLRPLKTALRLLHATLREIFDERAYDRYLTRTHAARGRVSYRAFIAENSELTARKARCC